MSLKVEDVMVRDVVTIGASSTVKKAAEVMDKFDIGCLIVGEDGRILGIITERDLLKRVVAEAKSVTKTRVMDVMSSPLTTVKPSADVEDAVELMFKAKIKRLPVVTRRKRLAGLFTLTDVARCQPYLMKILKQLNSRRRLLTDKEKKVIKKYLETGRKPKGFQKTLHRCQGMQAVQEDLDLVGQFLVRAGVEVSPKAS
jgi:CBS domain-containing protein